MYASSFFFLSSLHQTKHELFSCVLYIFNQHNFQIVTHFSTCLISLCHLTACIFQWRKSRAYYFYLAFIIVIMQIRNSLEICSQSWLHKTGVNFWMRYINSQANFYMQFISDLLLQNHKMIQFNYRITSANINFILLFYLRDTVTSYHYSIVC